MTTPQKATIGALDMPPPLPREGITPTTSNANSLQRSLSGASLLSGLTVSAGGGDASDATDESVEKGDNSMDANMRKSKIHWIIHGKKASAVSQSIRRLREQLAKCDSATEPNFAVYQAHIALAHIADKFRRAKPGELPVDTINTLALRLKTAGVKLDWNVQSKFLLDMMKRFVDSNEHFHQCRCENLLAAIAFLAAG